MAASPEEGKIKWELNTSGGLVFVKCVNFVLVRKLGSGKDSKFHVQNLMQVPNISGNSRLLALHPGSS